MGSDENHDNYFEILLTFVLLIVEEILKPKILFASS